MSYKFLAMRERTNVQALAQTDQRGKTTEKNVEGRRSRNRDLTSQRQYSLSSNLDFGRTIGEANLCKASETYKKTKYCTGAQASQWTNEMALKSLGLNEEPMQRSKLSERKTAEGPEAASWLCVLMVR
jgi:hypothetical protein